MKDFKDLTEDQQLEHMRTFKVTKNSKDEFNAYMQAVKDMKKEDFDERYRLKEQEEFFDDRVSTKQSNVYEPGDGEDEIFYKKMIRTVNRFLGLD